MSGKTQDSLSLITVLLTTNGKNVAAAHAYVPETTDLLAALTIANAQFFSDSPQVVPCVGEQHAHG